MPALDVLKGLNLDNTTATLWTFKGPRGPAGSDPSYTGYWVETTDDVDAVLKETVASESARIEEVLDYGLLAQNHETSALSITTIETHAGLIVDQAAAETATKKVASVKRIMNSDFYAIKLVHDETVIHAVRKTDSGWKTRKAINTRSLFFSDNQLDVDDRPHFDLAKSIDFFIVGGDILCLHKGRFESILRYKQAHKEDFEALQNDPQFASVFDDLAPLIEHVGENKIQLRRASAIRQKAHFRDEGFMARLREHQAEYGFTIQFDGDGKIVATPETISQIITALLDHRLASGFSELVYDVQNTTPVQL